MRNKTQQRQQQEIRLHPLLTYPNGDSKVDQHQPLILLDAFVSFKTTRIHLFKERREQKIEWTSFTESLGTILHRGRSLQI